MHCVHCGDTKQAVSIWKQIMGVAQASDVVDVVCCLLPEIKVA